MSYSLYIGIGFFAFFVVIIVMWSVCQYKNRKTMEEMLQRDIDSRNGIFYINSGRAVFPFDYGLSPTSYGSPITERQYGYSAPNVNSVSRSNSPPPYETFYAIDVEIPPSYDECIKLGFT